MGGKMALSATLNCSPAWMVRVAKLRGLSDMVGPIGRIQACNYGNNLAWRQCQGNAGNFPKPEVIWGKFFSMVCPAMDSFDQHILTLLQRDASISLKDLAEAVNLSTTPCWKRVKRLEEEGYILGRVALLDPERLGLGLTVFVQLKTQRHDRPGWSSSRRR
jgi:transcriptional regulator, AsnC family